MKNKPIFRQVIALLLMVLLVGSLFPAALAVEDGSAPEDTTQSAADPPGTTPPMEESTLEEVETTESTEPAAEPTEPAEPTDPPEGTTPEEVETAEPTGPSADPAEPEKSALEKWAERLEELLEQQSALNVAYVADADSAAMEQWRDLGINTYAADGTTSAGYRQYTFAVNTGGQSVTFTYNGKTYTHSNMLLLGVDTNGDNIYSLTEAAYCIEPGTVINGSVYTGEDKTGADPWGKLGFEKQYAVGLALLYGAPNGLWSDDKKTELTYQLATAIIVHEICLGWRSSTVPYNCTNTTYIDAFNHDDLYFSGGLYTSVAGKVDKATLMYAYNYISNKMAKHALTLSFASVSSLNPPSYALSANGNGTYGVTLTDTNGVLSEYTFTDGNGLTFSKQDNVLTVTSTTANPNVTVAPTRTVPSAENSAYIVWNSADGKDQELITVKSARNDPVPAYFKLEQPSGNLKISKTSAHSSTGTFSLSIYDSKYNLISNKTISIGESITISDLEPGTYYVREWNSAGWYCTNPLSSDSSSVWFKATVTAGITSEVVINNEPYGAIKIIKVLASDGTLNGWTFKVTDSAGMEVTGSPFTTDANGTITTGQLLPGTYTIEEIIPADSPYYCLGQNPQTVTVKAGETALVSFTNSLRPGQISIEKVNFLGEHLAGAKFLLEWSTDNGATWTPVVYSSKADVVLGGCTSVGLTDGCLVTGEDGIITFEGLYPSWGNTAVLYRLTEVEAPEGYQLLADYAFIGELPVDDLTVNLTVHNSAGYTLPHTGSTAGRLLPFMGLLLFTPALCLGIFGINGKAVDIKILTERKKKQ